MPLKLLKYLAFTALLASPCRHTILAAVYQEAGGRVVIEAEHFHERTKLPDRDHHWHIVPNEDGTDFLQDVGDPVFENARGNAYLQMLPSSGLNFTSEATIGTGPAAFYKVHIQTSGKYQIYLRWRGFDGGSDSMYSQLVGFGDGIGGTVADWYRYAQGSNLNFQNSWQGVAGFERTDASGSNVPATWDIPEPGIYTIKITHREDGVAFDTLVFQLSNLPAPGEPGPDESSVSTAFPPSVSSSKPSGGAVGVFPDTSIEIKIEDGGNTQVAQNSVKLNLNGTDLTPAITKSGSATTVTAKPPALLASGAINTVTITFNDTASPPKSISQSIRFTTEAYPTLPASLARPDAAIDKNSSGFSVFVHQARSDAGLPNSTARAEGQLRGFLLDSTTGKPFVNHATAGGNFTDENVINWNQDAPAAVGNFNTDTGNADESIPGIPGDESSTDNIAAELITFLELPAGLTRLGVNSDDGFRVTAADNPRDAAGLQLGLFDGGRGAADTPFSVLTEKAGIYPIRLIWYEGSGGANLEFFSVDLATGQKILVNDRSNAKALKAFRVSTAPLLPFANQITPSPSGVNVNAGSRIFVELADAGTAVNQSSIKLMLNGTAVTPAITKSGNLIQVIFDPPGLLASGSKNEAKLEFSDNATPPNVIAKVWQFTVQDFSSFTVVPPSFRVPEGAIDKSSGGFNVRMHQIAIGRPGGNNLPAPLTQLADGFIDPGTSQPYANLVDSSLEPGQWTGTVFKETDVINYNQDARDNPAAGAGNFRPDKPIPGIPGVEGSTDNIAMETTTFLELKRGVYRMGVNSDDGFVVGTALNPKDAFPLRLGLFDGGRGAADSLFNFVIEEPGIYPFSLTWWEGGGGANVEWFHEDADTGQRILVNDPLNPRSIKAFRTATGSRPFLKSIDPAPGAAGAPLNANIEIVLVDGSTQVAPNSIQLAVNGSNVTPTVTKSGAETTIKFDPPSDLPDSSKVELKLTYNDTSSPPSSRTVTVSFTTDRAPVNLPPFEQGADGLVVMEAENFHDKKKTDTHAWLFAQSPADFSGVGTMYGLPDPGAVIGFPDALTMAPRLDFKVKFVKTGTHYFWFRGADGGGNSIHAGIDDVDPSGTTMDNIDQGCCGTRAVGGTANVWVGAIDATPEGRSKFEVTTAGVHMIHVWMREDGQIVDKLLITTDATFLPSGAGPAESTREGGAGGPPPKFNALTIQGGNIIVSWTGSGKLQVADAVSGPWTDSNNQNNPQTIPVSGTMKFYRLRQ